MQCENCGHPLNAWNAVCPSCGTAAPDTSAEQIASQLKQATPGTITRADVTCYKAIGIATIAIGILLLVRLAMNLFQIMLHFGVGQALLSGVFGLPIPILILISGAATLFMAERPGFGAGGSFVSGTLIYIVGFQSVAVLIIAQLGSVLVVAWNSLSFLLSLTTILFIGFAFLVNKNAGSDTRKVLVIATAAGLLLGAASFFLLASIGRLLRTPQEAFAYFMSADRLLSCWLPLAAFGIALNSLLVIKNARAFIAVIVIRLVVAVPLAYVLLMMLGLGLTGVVLAMIAAELIGAVISGLMLYRN